MLELLDMFDAGNIFALFIVVTKVTFTELITTTTE